jgi:hypothetical protein
VALDAVIDRLAQQHGGWEFTGAARWRAELMKGDG